MKKLIAILLVFILLFSISCGQTDTKKPEADKTEAGKEDTTTPAGEEPADEPEEPSEEPGGVDDEPAEVGDKHLIVAVDPDYESFDPALAYEVYANMILHNCYDTLIVYSNEGTAELGAAEKYEISEDQLTYTFTLKDGITYASGQPATAADWVWGIERAMAKGGNGAFLAAGIEKLEAPDDKTIVFTLADIDPSFPTKLTYSLFGLVEKTLLEEHGGTNDANDGASDWLNTTSAGSGPYVLASYTPKVDLVLEKNLNYWGNEPYYDKITIMHVSESASQVMMVQTGDIDIAMNIDAEQARSLDGAPGVDVVYCHTLTMSFLLMNRDAQYGPIADPLVQKAIRKAVDYAGIQTLGGEGSTTPVSPFPAGLFASAEPLDVASAQNVEEAKDLLAQAGYPDGFELDFYVPTSNVEGVDLLLLAQKVQADLKAIGIETNIIAEDIMISLETYRNGQQPFGLWYWSPDYPDNTSNLAFLPGNSVGLRANWAAEMDPDLVELGKKAGSETDDSTRIAIYDEIHKKMLEDSPFVMILQFKSQYATRDDIKGADYNDRYKIDLGLVHK